MNKLAAAAALAVALHAGSALAEDPVDIVPPSTTPIPYFPPPPVLPRSEMILPIVVDLPSAVLGGLVGAAVALAGVGVVSWRRTGTG